ncbi:uncharacterized protein LOC112572198 [Pomacea canaliculata]|uniref:uncharacterized protein LOC112572198 n=1 Tax=Pomacea canaliculata TaxID=400727 RepID=UPI000D73C727|nr:uncharacterized protein LOC112572198 [Pomacea canaliculata]
MEPVLNPVAQSLQKYLLSSDQIPGMAAGTILSPLAEPFVPRDPVFWPGQLLSDSSCHDWSNDARTQCQMSHVNTGGQINVDTNGWGATTGPPAIRAVGYERVQKREQQKAETPGSEPSNFDVGVRGKSYSCEITAAFLEGLQGGVAILRDGFCPGEYTRFSGVTLWDKLTSDRSFNDLECMARSTDTDAVIITATPPHRRLIRTSSTAATATPLACRLNAWTALMTRRTPALMPVVTSNRGLPVQGSTSLASGLARLMCPASLTL